MPTPDQTDPSVSAAETRESALIARIRGGDRAAAAWEELLSSHQDRLYAVCLRMVGHADDAADLAQDAMVKIIRGIDSYDGRSRFGTWAIRVAMNLCLSHLRARKLRRHASLDPSRSEFIRSIRTPGALRSGGAGEGGGGGVGGEPEPERGVQMDEERRRVADAMDKLADDHKAALILRDVQGLDYDVIAEVLGVAVGTVKSRLFRARVALREVLEGRPPDQEHDR